MNEETINKVLTGETDIAKMSHDDFVEMLKCLGRMYFSRVMNCVDGTGKSDKEWTALSRIFSRVVETITEKTTGNAVALHEALEALVEVVEAWKDHLPPAIRDGELSKVLEKANSALAALAEPPRNCDQKAREVLERVHTFLGILIRENLVKDAPFLDEGELENESDLADDVYDLLHTPPRNCDVGTPDEQMERFNRFCVSHYNGPDGHGVIPSGCDCPCQGKDGCNAFVWEHMPYEAEAQKGGEK